MTSANATTLPLSGFRPQHFQLAVSGKVATVTLNRPEKKNPLTFESYRELTDFFAAAQKDEALKAIVITGAGGNFSSGGDVFEIIGQGRAAELLYTGRVLRGEEAERWGFLNRLCESDAVLADAQSLAAELADGPTFANAMTKRMLEMEWAMSVESAIEAEAVAQALCMQTEDFARAYAAFAAKQKPVFEGN